MKKTYSTILIHHADYNRFFSFKFILKINFIHSINYVFFLNINIIFYT